MRPNELPHQAKPIYGKFRGLKLTSKWIITLFCASLYQANSLADSWGTEPLGRKIESSEESKPPVIKRDLKSTYRKFPAQGNPLALVRDGVAECILIVPKASTQARNAAEQLQAVLLEMTTVSLSICEEDKIQLISGQDGEAIIDPQGKRWNFALWIGPTNQSLAKGITAQDLKPEGFRMKTSGSWIFLVGNDFSHTGLPVKGTLYGAIALMERYLDVRWLWPGTVGTVIPKKATVVLPPFNEQDEPAISQRIMRNSARISNKVAIGLKVLNRDEGEDRYLETKKNTGSWLVNQRTGSSLRLEYGHTYDDWYAKYGQTHPDWFALQPDETRIQIGPRPRLCKSNPDLAKAVADNILERSAKPSPLDCFSISPSDGGSKTFFCMCLECRKLDPANGTSVKMMFAKDENRAKRFYVDYPSLSDRVATYYNRIAERVAETNPNVRLGAYAYSAYRDPPLAVTLHPSIIVGFVGLNYFNEAQRQSDLKRWDGWCARSSQQFLRPNFLLGGNALPAVYVNRMAADIKHCYQTGMIATDFDSVLGDWSTQGLNYYVLAKLLWDPSLNVNEIVRDYCEMGFGEAAPQIARYFTLLEKATDQLALGATPDKVEKELREGEDERTTEPLPPNFQEVVCQVYTIEMLSELRTILNEASAANHDEAVKERIRFLKLGIDYAEALTALYRQIVAKGNTLPERTALLDFHRTQFIADPLAINSINRLYRGFTLFRYLP